MTPEDLEYEVAVVKRKAEALASALPPHRHRRYQAALARTVAKQLEAALEAAKELRRFMEE